MILNFMLNRFFSFLSGYNFWKIFTMSSIKTPITILNEMMVKKKIVPVFELIISKGINQFTYQVSCDGLVAIGSAGSKKDAKQEAANQMLEKIAARDAQLTGKSLKRSLFTKDIRENPIICKKLKTIPTLNAVGSLIVSLLGFFNLIILQVKKEI